MIHLKELLSSFTHKEQENFLLFLKKKNKRKDVKNIDLTKMLIDGNFSSIEISLKLYGTQNKIALHALRKRLFTALIDFIALTSIKDENSLDIQLIKAILAARNLLKKGHFKVGYQILDKTLTVAKQNQLFTILNEIYHSKIEYAYKYPLVDINQLIKDFKENQNQLTLENNLNIAYAKIRKSLEEYQHNKKSINIKHLIETTLKEQNINNFEIVSFKSLYQIIQITHISSTQKFDFWSIEKFLIDTYKTIKTHNAKESQLYYHIEVLYIIANVLFRNKKMDESLHFLNNMWDYMLQNNKKYFAHYIYKHQLLLSLNYNFSNLPEKAISILEPLVNSKIKDVVAKLDIELSLIVFYYHNNSIEKAKKLLATFYKTDTWYVNKVGVIWTIKKNLIEILFHIDLGNIDLVDSRLKSFKKNYTKILKDIDLDNVLTYLKLIEIYYKNPEIVTSKSFYNKVELSFKWIENKKEDIFMISFYAWLKAKMTKENVYKVTLSLINK